MMYQNVLISEFTLDSVQVQGNKTWAAGYSLNHVSEEGEENVDISYETKHTIVEMKFNNCHPAFAFSLLEEHVRSINDHKASQDITVKKLSITCIGSGDDTQYIVKMDYVFSSKYGDDLAKASTSKIILDKDNYKGYKDLEKIVIELRQNIFDYVIKGQKYKEDVHSTEMAGNTVEV